MKATIRLARYREIHFIVDVIADLVEEWGDTCPPMIEPLIYEQLTPLISNGLVSIAVVKHNDRPVVAGVAALDVKNFPWNPNYRFLAPVYYGVSRIYRNSDAGIKLFDEMIAMARLHKGDLMFSHMSPINPELKDALAERKGGERRGSFHWFPFNQKDEDALDKTA